VDVITLEAIRIFSPEIYDEVWRNKEAFTETENGFSSNTRGKEIRKQKIETIFEKADPKYRDITKSIIFELFPQMKMVYGNTSYNGDWQDKWNKERRACSQYRFDKYFLFSIPEGEISQNEIDKIVKNSKSTSKTEKILIDLVKKKKLRSFLEKLSLYLDDVPEENVEAFVLALFNLSDQFPRERLGMAFLDTESWCVRFGFFMLLKIKDLGKRKKVLLRLVKKSQSLQVPIVLISIEVREKKGDTDRSEPLIIKEDLKLFSGAILEKIKDFVKTDRLLGTPNLLYTLFFWRDISSIEEPKKYIKNLILTDKGLVRLIESMMFARASQGLEDHVSMTTWAIDPNNIKEFTDPEELRKKVQALSKKEISKSTEKQQLGLKLFLESFDKNMNSFLKDIENT